MISDEELRKKADDLSEVIYACTKISSAHPFECNSEDHIYHAFMSLRDQAFKEGKENFAAKIIYELEDAKGMTVEFNNHMDYAIEVINRISLFITKPSEEKK